MKLTPPKNITFWISVIFVVAGLLGYLKVLAFLTPFAFWLVVIGYVILFLGNLVKGL
jgi:hypothetical protein